MTPDDGSVAPLVRLCSCRHELEAQSLRAVLEDAGISAVVDSSPFAAIPCDWMPGSEVAVRVPRDQFDLAKQTLEISRIHAESIDWDEVDLGEMPTEVRDVIEQRQVVHGFGRLIGVSGLIIGFAILVMCTIAIIVMSLN